MGKFKEYEYSAYQSEDFDQPSFMGLIDIIKKFSFLNEGPSPTERISESEAEELL